MKIDIYIESNIYICTVNVVMQNNEYWFKVTISTLNFNDVETYGDCVASNRDSFQLLQSSLLQGNPKELIVPKACAPKIVTLTKSKNKSAVSIACCGSYTGTVWGWAIA